MTKMDKWNKIVELYNQSKYSKEDIVQHVWENILSEIFGYSRLFGEVDSQRSIQIGATERAVADIIIKDGENDLFIVEIKQGTFDNGEKQLLSYLKLLHVDIGIIINQRITLIAYDYRKYGKEQIKYSFNFETNSLDGEAFVELFSKPFNRDRVQDYIIGKSKSSKHIEEIKELISNKYIIELLQTHLSHKYDDSDINAALKAINISVSEHQVQIEPITNGFVVPTRISQSEFKIGQKVQIFFSKSQKNNALSEQMLTNLCSKEYSKSKFNLNLCVLKEIKNLNSIDKDRKDLHGHARYYKDVYVFNGKNYLLCSQWTTAQENHFYQWEKFFEAKINV